MSDSQTTIAFLESQIEPLEPFGFLLLGSALDPWHRVEVRRQESGELQVIVPARPPGAPELTTEQRTALQGHGFTVEHDDDPNAQQSLDVPDVGTATSRALDALHAVFGEPDDLPIDVVHGNRRAEHEAFQRLAATREKIEKALPNLIDTSNLKRDADDDYVFPVGDVNVTVAPRIAPGGGIVVRVIAIANVGVAVTPELGLFLANLNFGLIFGRFALDAQNRAIWVDESLLGDHFSDEELRFIVHAVAGVADEWDDRLKQMFGGSTYQEVLEKRADAPSKIHKPGQGLYL